MSMLCFLGLCSFLACSIFARGSFGCHSFGCCCFGCASSSASVFLVSCSIVCVVWPVFRGVFIFGFCFFLSFPPSLFVSMCSLFVAIVFAVCLFVFLRLLFWYVFPGIYCVLFRRLRILHMSFQLSPQWSFLLDLVLVQLLFVLVWCRLFCVLFTLAMVVLYVFFSCGCCFAFGCCFLFLVVSFLFVLVSCFVLFVWLFVFFSLVLFVHMIMMLLFVVFLCVF